MWASSEGSVNNVDDAKARLPSALSAGSFVPPEEANESFPLASLDLKDNYLITSLLCA